MNPAILLAVKNIALNLVTKKVTKAVNRKFDKLVPEANEDGDIVEIVDTVEALAVSPKKVTAWVSVVTALVYFASANGYIDPSVATLINSILSNAETVDAIEGMVE